MCFLRRTPQPINPKDQHRCTFRSEKALLFAAPNMNLTKFRSAWRVTDKASIVAQPGDVKCAPLPSDPVNPHALSSNAASMCG
jgi:hypothetical protein